MESRVHRVGVPVEGAVRRRSAFRYCGALTCGLMLLLAPGVSWAAGTLDQSQIDKSGGGSPIQGPDATPPISKAQTIRAGLTGGLDAVKLYLAKRGSPARPAPVRVQIRNTSSGLPGSKVLASASVSGSRVSKTGSFVTVHFASPAPVRKGTHYAIVVYTSDTGTSTAYFWYASDSNPYSAGALWTSDASPPSTIWSESSAADLVFKTYVACVVPNLKGKTLAQAKGPLADGGCTLGKVTKKKSSGKPGIVLSQQPKAGNQLAQGSKVAVVVSSR